MNLNKADRKVFLPPREKTSRTRTPRKKQDDVNDEDLEEEGTVLERKQRAAEKKLREGTMMERCRAIIDLLVVRPDGFWFKEPVSIEDVPDYLDVVTNPMDYSRIKAKLKAGEYGDDHLAFAADVRLVFANALKYNYDRENQCHIAACANMQIGRASCRERV